MAKTVHSENDSSICEHVFVLGVKFSCSTFSGILESVSGTIAKREKRYISITNTESLYCATRNRFHRHYINNSMFSCCDGIGVALASRLLGNRIPRLHGPDLMLECCQYGIGKKWRHFFYGGREGVPQLLSGHLEKRFPGLITAGTYSPPFRDLTQEEDREIVARINESEPDIVWVGLGLLKQEKWIADHIDRLRAPLLVGVGAAFDFHAGTIKRAPHVFRKAGLEWLYRLAFEPRMWVRNVRSLVMVLDIVRKALAITLRGGSND